jgi:hypothetical protein
MGLQLVGKLSADILVGRKQRGKEINENLRTVNMRKNRRQLNL